MKEQDKHLPSLHPRQYQLAEKPNAEESLSRRNYFKYMGSGVASFLVLSDILASEVLDRFTSDEKLVAEDALAAWIHIEEN